MKLSDFYSISRIMDLNQDKILAICKFVFPKSWKQMLEVPDMAGFCSILILKSELITKPHVRHVTRKRDWFLWMDRQCNQAFMKFKELLMNAPALDLPDLNKQFDLYTHERQEIAAVILTQLLCPLRSVMLVSFNDCMLCPKDGHHA